MNAARFEGTPVRLAAIAGLLVVLVTAQASASTMVPSGVSEQTGRAIGRAGFAYLSGLRTFAAAVIWNRLEPQFDLYYANKSLADQVQLLPMIRIVQSLDPQFEQAYYIAAWVVARHGNLDEAYRLSREGIAKNPASGLLRTNYIQIMMLEDNERAARGEARLHVQEAVEQADAAVEEGTRWANDADKVEGYAVIAAAYKVAGMTARAEAAKAVGAGIAKSGSSTNIGGAGHDHDGDGTPDH